MLLPPACVVLLAPVAGVAVVCTVPFCFYFRCSFLLPSFLRFLLCPRALSSLSLVFPFPLNSIADFSTRTNGDSAGVNSVFVGALMAVVLVVVAGWYANTYQRVNEQDSTGCTGVDRARHAAVLRCPLPFDNSTFDGGWSGLAAANSSCTVPCSSCVRSSPVRWFVGRKYGKTGGHEEL